ncbi:substrate-binding domain-containing protein [bacterium]|nr:substrate-binding domain-containing protein [bacterium]
MRHFRWLVLIVLSALLAACPQAEPGDNTPASQPAASTSTDTAPGTASLAGGAVTVWAEVLLAEPLTALSEDFKAQYAGGWRVEYKERGVMLTAITADSPPELPAVVLFADTQVRDQLIERGQIEEATLRTFAGDVLVLAQIKDGLFATGSLYDIYKAPFTHLLLGSPQTTVGYYGEQALISEGCFSRVESRLKLVDSTAELVGSLLSEEKVVGIVMASQVVQSGGLEVMTMVSERTHEDIRYSAAATTGHSGDPGVMDLLRFLAEDEAIQLKLEGYGLLNRETALRIDQ